MAFAICKCLPHRYTVALLSFFGMLISVGYRTCFALVITHIVVSNTTTENATVGAGESIFPNCSTTGTDRDRVVHWSGSTVDLFHTAFFVGQFVASIPGGAFASVQYGKRIFGFTILTTSVLQLLLPVASEYIWLIYIIRAVQGVVEAVSVPAMNAVIGAWAPKTERARLINIAYAGVYLSPALAMFTTGAVTCYIGWDTIMYIYGSVGVAWSILWLLVVFPSPSSYPHASEQERALLEQQTAAIGVRRIKIWDMPWCKFFTSMPVIAIWVGAFCRNFIFALLITAVQQYYKDVYNLTTALIGLLSAVPHIFMAVFMIFGSNIFDALAKRNILSMTKTRKLAQASGFGIQGACILALYGVDNYEEAFILFCVGVAFSGFAISGYQTNPLDLAPQYIGPLTGISRTGMLGAVISTTLVSQLTGDSRALKDWQYMFLIAGILHLFGVVFYLIFASGSLQPWAQGTQNVEVDTRADDPEEQESNVNVKRRDYGSTMERPLLGEKL